MIRLEKVSKKFGTGVFAISDLTLFVDKGEFVFLVGPSGSGKTTIFRLLIRDIFPSSGTVIVDNWDVVKLPKSKIPHLRKKVGVVFQDLKLLLDRTVLENIILPLEIAGVNQTEALAKVEEVLEGTGIIEHKNKFPIQLSGGELQRVTIARALVLSPEIILADEPTGNLDLETSWGIVKLLSDINNKGTTVIMATHNTDIIKNLSKRIIKLDRGHLVVDDPSAHSASSGQAGQAKKKDKKPKK